MIFNQVLIGFVGALAVPSDTHLEERAGHLLLIQRNVKPWRGSKAPAQSSSDVPEAEDEFTDPADCDEFCDAGDTPLVYKCTVWDGCYGCSFCDSWLAYEMGIQALTSTWNVPTYGMRFSWSTFGKNSACDAEEGGGAVRKGLTQKDCMSWCENAFGCGAAQYREDQQRCKIWAGPMTQAVESAGYQCFTVDESGGSWSEADSKSNDDASIDFMTQTKQGKSLWHTMGEDTACRLNEHDDSDDGDGMAKRYNDVASTEECREMCEGMEDCLGVEYRDITGTCEVWTRSIKATIYAPGYECAIYAKAERWPDEKHADNKTAEASSHTRTKKNEKEKNDKADATSVTSHNSTKYTSSNWMQPFYCGFAIGVNARSLTSGAKCDGGDDCATEDCKDLDACVERCNRCDQCHGIRYQPDGAHGIRCRLKSLMRYSHKAWEYADSYDKTEGQGWALYVNSRDKLCAGSKAV